MCDKLILDQPSASLLCLVVSLWSLEVLLPFRIIFSLGKKKKLQGIKYDE
jgi:hypothetical protein